MYLVSVDLMDRSMKSQSFFFQSDKVCWNLSNALKGRNADVPKKGKFRFSKSKIELILWKEYWNKRTIFKIEL